MSQYPPPNPQYGQQGYPPPPQQGYGGPPPPGYGPPPPGQPQYGPQGQPLNYATPFAGAGGVVCPRCGQPAAKKVSFTWWGGVLGPKMFNHHKCAACSFTFNGKTGKSNNTAILIYTIVAFAIAIVLGLVIVMAN